ncbi:MAG TPA: hypothetical protein VFI73_11155 [Candidatus Nitrosopolaris sp.]|nr:hypothetical protein [Candidatus Nitrosopolaris sp.]
MIRQPLFPLLLLLFSVILLYSTMQHALGQSATNSTSNKIGNSTTSSGRAATIAVTGPRSINSIIGNGTTLTYQNPDFGIKMQYPSNWIKQEDNLLLHTVVAFSLIHQNIFDFTNTTLAELDLRVYNAPQNETSAKLNIGQINTQGQVIISHYKNETTTLGGLPALKIINYFFGDTTQKEMQVWTFVPSKNILVELIYVAQPSKYPVSLPIVERMINSVEIAH